MPDDFKREYLENEKRTAAERQAKLSKIGMGSESAPVRQRPSGARVPEPARRPERPRSSSVGITQSSARPVGNNAPVNRPVQRPGVAVGGSFSSGAQKRTQTGSRPSAQAPTRPVQRPQQRSAQQSVSQGRTPQQRPVQNQGAPSYAQRRTNQGAPQRPASRQNVRRDEMNDSAIFKKNLSDNDSRAMMFALTGRPDEPTDGGEVDVIDMGRSRSRVPMAKPGDNKAGGKKHYGKYIGRFFFCVLTALVFTIVAVFSAVFVVAHGPSETARNLAVQSALQASATKWVPGLFLSNDVVQQILDDSKNVVQDVLSLDDYSSSDNAESPVSEDEWAAAKDGMIFQTVNGSTYKAYVLLVKDPARVFVGTSTDNFDNATAGVNIFDAVKRFNALAAINAGEFADNGGHGSGYAPLGLTFSKGECVWNDNTTKTFMGFTNDNKLIVRESMTEAEAKELGVRDAVSFQTGNTLIEQKDENVIMYYAEDNTGTSQRTAIGQRADGTVIMIVTDGRTASSLGATHNDMINMMVSYGAVSAGMLDGGSSAMMYYDDYYTKYGIDTSTLDEYQMQGLVNKYKAFTDPRRIPTFFMVSPE